VVAVDLAGHGESGTDRRAWTMPAFGDDVVAVVEQLGLEYVVLVGHSMGGDVISESAVRLGDRVTGLVWVDVYRTLGEPSSPEQLEAFVASFREDFGARTRDFVHSMFVPGSDPDLVEWVAADMSSASPDTALDAMESAIGNHDAALARLQELTAPVVAINPGYRPTDVESLRRHGVEAVVMPGVGHFLMLEDPATFNGLLGEVLDDLVRVRGGRVPPTPAP
jgi:pimeloyl-ACP methyl ester carboxylesterase